MKNTLKEMNNETGILGNRVNQMEERVSGNEEINLEMTQKGET